MNMDEEGPAVMLRFDAFKRIKYGHPDYRDKVSQHISLEAECHMAEKRSAWLQEEHCIEWVSNK